jgi:23S rRNA G2445 N2-methylase RlmL
MAKAFPRSRFWGFDVHGGSIAAARGLAHDAGIEDRVAFDVARAEDYPKRGYDLICFFDCLHDMGRPIPGPRCATI